MIESFWAESVAATGIDEPYTAWVFGDPSLPQRSTEPALLVWDGPTRATVGLASNHEEDEEPMPKPGDLNPILDGHGSPVCVIRTTDAVRPDLPVPGNPQAQSGTLSHPTEVPTCRLFAILATTFSSSPSRSGR